MYQIGTFQIVVFCCRNTVKLSHACLNSTLRETWHNTKFFLVRIFPCLGALHTVPIFEITQYSRTFPNNREMHS